MYKTEVRKNCLLKCPILISPERSNSPDHQPGKGSVHATQQIAETTIGIIVEVREHCFLRCKVQPQSLISDGDLISYKIGEFERFRNHNKRHCICVCSDATIRKPGYATISPIPITAGAADILHSRNQCKTTRL